MFRTEMRQTIDLMESQQFIAKIRISYRLAPELPSTGVCEFARCGDFARSAAPATGVERERYSRFGVWIPVITGRGSGLFGRGIQQAVVYRLHTLIAFTGRLLQTWPVQDGDSTSSVSDQARSLKLLRDRRDGHTPYPEQIRGEFLFEVEFGCSQSILRHQQPFAVTPLQGMAAITCR